MRLGLVTPGFSAAEHDWCIPALLNLVRTLARDHDVTVFALRYPHTRTPYEVHAARVIPFGAAEARGPGRALMAGRAGRAIVRAAEHQRFDVLHALWAHEPGAIACSVGRRIATPVVVSILGGEMADVPALGYGGAQGQVNRRLIRYALGHATRVTVPSPLVATQAMPIVGAERLVEIPLGVDTQRFRPGLARGDGTRHLDGVPALLQVGSLVPIKDHETLIRAFARLRRPAPKARLHLVGDGPLRAQLEDLATSLGLSNAVRFHDAVAHDQLPDLYRQADLVTISSQFESQCLAVLEAAACGRTLAGTAVGLLPSLVSPRHLAPPGDVSALARALRRALEDHTGTSEAEAEKRARIIDARFGVETATARFVRLYHSLQPAESSALDQESPS